MAECEEKEVLFVPTFADWHQQIFNRKLHNHGTKFHVPSWSLPLRRRESSTLPHNNRMDRSSRINVFKDWAYITSYTITRWWAINTNYVNEKFSLCWQNNGLKLVFYCTVNTPQYFLYLSTLVMQHHEYHNIEHLQVPLPNL